MSGPPADQAAREVVAMQFAAGASIAGLAEEWDRSPEWVEQAIREALLARIPQRDGGMKPLRTETRAAERTEDALAVRAEQKTLEFT